MTSRLAKARGVGWAEGDGVGWGDTVGSGRPVVGAAVRVAVGVPVPVADGVGGGVGDPPPTTSNGVVGGVGNGRLGWEWKSALKRSTAPATASAVPKITRITLRTGNSMPLPVRFGLAAAEPLPQRQREGGPAEQQQQQATGQHQPRP